MADEKLKYSQGYAPGVPCIPMDSWQGLPGTPISSVGYNRHTGTYHPGSYIPQSATPTQMPQGTDQSVEAHNADPGAHPAIHQALAEETAERIAADAELNAELQEHAERTDNPHGVTAEQVGAYTKEETDEKIVRYGLDMMYVNANTLKFFRPIQG